MFQVSNVSTRAVVAWDQSAANSRRSSVQDPTPPQQGARIGQHLSRLHKKAQEHLQQHDGGGRQSVMSECDNPSSSPALSSYGAGRRASDPVRVLDRNFGVGARHRSGSYTGQQQYHYSKNHYQQYQPPPGFNQSGFGFSNQQTGSSSSQEQWQFNGFQQGFPPNYNYNFNAQQPLAAQQPAPQPNWNHQHQWNNWNYYNNGQAQQQPAATAASGETSSVSYQRTLEYVQQCQQQSWSANSAQQ